MIGWREGTDGRGNRSHGRILAVKWGLNPNSSSLGVDVTFFLFGATALALATPVISALIRWKKPSPASTGTASTGSGPDASTDASAGPSHDDLRPETGSERQAAHAEDHASS